MHLREHLKICNRSDEDTASSKGQVLRETNRRIVYLWAEQWKGFPHIQNAWELAQTHTIGRLEGLVCTTAGQLLCTLNTTETLSYGMELGRLVLDNFMRAMHRSISTPRSPGCASALQLLRHLVEFGDGALADQVRQQFDWTMKSLKQLPLARSRVAGLGIRRLWIRFVMSFFAAKNCQSSVEILRMRSVFGDLFLGVEKDSYFDLYVLLTQVFEHVVMNQRISRGDKRRAFGAGLMGNLAKAARRNRELVQLSAVGIKQMAKFDPENTVSEEVTNDSVAALVVRFFRGMMTHPGYGICYRQYGLYPAPGRQQGVAAEGVHDVATVARGSSAEMHELCNSQILYILIRCIRPEESRMMAELATDILRANPELIAPFWRSTKLPIEPRVSVQFLGASAFALNVMRQPLPTETVGAGPPQVLTLVEHIAPAALKREQLGRGLQMRGSPLVQYRTLLLIDALLSKLDMTCEWIGERRQIKTWHSLEKQLVAVVRQRMPGWKLILTIHHDLNKMPANSQQRVLLSGVLVSVMRGYQQYFSELILETRFEFGQLLAPENLQAMDNPLAAHVQLHVLNALACASNVQWLAQTHGQHSHTNVGSVLSVFLFAAQPQVRWAAQAACKSALVSTALFDHDAEEAQCWLDALAALTSTYAMRSSIGWAVSQHQQDQAHMVISFLENAIMQASKQPYKHADRVYAVAGDSSSTLLFSPLLSALVESAIAMLAADAKNMLKETEPAELDAFVTREIQGNIRFRLVREVACRIAEERGANAARALAVFLESVPAAIVAQRIAQIKDASNSQVTSKSHLIAIQKQISLLARMEFLAALYEPASKFETAKSVSSVSRVLEKEMQDMLDWGCGDIGARLDLLLERLGRVIGRIPLEKISQWLINWTLQMGAKRHGQAALAPVVRWIALYCRTGAGSHSIWDFEPFIKLAAQLPPVDDLSFMEALMRHLLISNRLGEHISRPAVQRLLAHLMLATRGSLRFSILIAWLLQRIAIPNAGLQLHGLSFVSALLVEHLELLATADKQLLVLPKALELFAPLLSKSLFGSSDFQQMIDSTATDLVRRTADSWLSKQEATRIWTPLVEHIVGHIESAAHHNADMRPAVYWLTFLRLIVAIVPLHMRESLVRTLSSITVTNVQVLCATAKTVFALRALDTSNQDMPTSVLTVERRLASQVLQQWAASLNSSESSLCQLLENAALKATVRLDVRLHVEANSQKGVCELQRRLRAELVQPNSSHLLSSDDIIRVLDMLWASTSSATSNNADANNWLILGRILRSDGMLRLHASRWIDQAASHGLNQLQGRTLAWLVAMIGTECHYFTSRRLSIWDDDESAQSVHKCLLNLVHRLFTDRSECLNDIATDDSMFRIVREFVQHSCDHNAVLQFYIQAAPLLAQPCAAEKRIALLQAMIQRTYLFTSEPDTLASLFNEVLQMAQAIIPSIGSARPASTELRLLSQLETAMQCCQHATAKRHIQDVNALLAAAFTRISQIVESLTIPFEEGVDLTESQIQQYVYCYPSSIFRLLAFAVYSVTPYASSAAAGKLEWFTVLRRLLNCRLFAKRAYDSELRDHLALFICGLWKLARPHISPWSASLNDYFTLDELEALAGAYAGSCSTVDQLYLQVIREYETATRQSVMRVLLVFGPLAADSFVKERINRIRYFIERDENDVGVVGPDIVANALAIVDGGRMLRLITEFPLSMDLVADENCDMNILQSLADSEALQCPYGAAECSRIYNAQVMLPWLWAIVSSGHLMDIKRLIDTNALSLAIVSLSSQSERMRKLAYFILDKAYAIILQDKHTLFGKSQCIVLLDVLRNSITERTSLQFPQIPYTLTLFAALSLPITLRPEHTMYAPINRLLLRRPWLRTNELPLLRLVTQPSDTSVACRTFVLRMASQMARAFGQATDVFRRTDWLNTVLALSSSSLGDVQTGMAALRTIFNLSSADNSHILPLYVSKSRFSVLAWIKAQLQLELCSLQSACALVVTGSLGEHQGILEGNNMASVNMALANVIALIRVITRVIANFSLSQISSGQLIFNKFWIVQTPEQLVAPGQSAVLGMLQQTLTVLAQTLTRFKGQSFNSIYVPALTLVYSCMTAAHMLAEIQFGSTQSSSSSPALQSSQLVPAVLSVIRKMEHIEHPGIDVLKESMHNYDPCKVASIAHAQSVDSLFAVPTFGAYSLYAKCIDQLFSWILSVPGLKCMPNDMLDLVSYALAVGSPTTERAVGWIRECRGY
ncbi:hypothetical protein IWW36_002117 [Coemansia brasiliensis]|uniref:Uncharacterized protein n=1 Tax=Coemansia brasiliensis TaxID=2650707 RepID=A0A9W8M1C2_9FUNG|nr:hypothetical protein IWW36_002117 [Coemansia brasiliensis]